MQQVVSPKTVVGGVPQTQLFGLPLQVTGPKDHRQEESPLLQFVAKQGQRSSRLFGRHPSMTSTAALENTQLESITDLDPVQPRDGRRGYFAMFGLFGQCLDRSGLRHVQIRTGKEVGISVRPHSPATNRSSSRTSSLVIGSGKIRAILARCSANNLRQGTFCAEPSSGRTVYRRPSRRWMRTAPSRSQASRTFPGLRSKSRRVNVFISDKMSDIIWNGKRNFSPVISFSVVRTATNLQNWIWKHGS